MVHGSWRPITILPLPSKLLGKAIHFQMVIFLQIIVSWIVDNMDLEIVSQLPFFNWL